jgi:DHA2 family multidrug resistance protein-like MFS transporter
MLTPQLVKRVRAPFVLCGGLLVAAAGFTLLTRLDGELGLLVTGSVIVSLGLAAVFTLATDLMVGTAPPERAGAASAIAETGSEFGGALGIAVLGLIGTAVYRNAVPVGVDTLDEVSDPALLETARAAFTQSLQVTAGISAAVVLAAAVVALGLLSPGREPVLDNA